jgi:hypothetical protein
MMTQKGRNGKIISKLFIHIASGRKEEVMRLPEKSMLFNLTLKEEIAKEKLIYLERKISICNDKDDLFDLYCAADDIWIEFYEVMSNKDFEPDHKKLFIKRQKKLEEKPETITFNIHGCNVTFVNHR